MKRDLKYCHPRWPEEYKYIEMEIANISSQGISYFQSYWNYFDWVTYFGILAVILTRVLSVAVDNNTANELHPKVRIVSSKRAELTLFVRDSSISSKLFFLEVQ